MKDIKTMNSSFLGELLIIWEWLTNNILHNILINVVLKWKLIIISELIGSWGRIRRLGGPHELSYTRKLDENQEIH